MLDLYACEMDRLINRTLLFTAPTVSTAHEQVIQLASAALALREIEPDAKIAIATGRASFLGRLPVGQADGRPAHADGSPGRRAPFASTKPRTGSCLRDLPRAGCLATPCCSTKRERRQPSCRASRAVAQALSSAATVRLRPCSLSLRKPGTRRWRVRSCFLVRPAWASRGCCANSWLGFRVLVETALGYGMARKSVRCRPA
jgi:hypothetical protein